MYGILIRVLPVYRVDEFKQRNIKLAQIQTRICELAVEVARYQYYCGLLGKQRFLDFIATCAHLDPTCAPDQKIPLPPASDRYVPTNANKYERHYEIKECQLQLISRGSCLL